MSEYRFSLQKYKRGSKLSCPKCGKKVKERLPFRIMWVDVTMNNLANTIIHPWIILMTIQR